MALVKHKIKKHLILLTCFMLCLFFIISFYKISHSSLFLIKNVDVLSTQSTDPIDPHHIKMLAAVPIEKITLFELDLTEIEKRILVDPWIKKVKLEKVFPNSVRISTQFRKPIALLQGEKANISYLDEEGIIFGRLNLTLKEDLPIISGVPLKDSYLVQKILNLLQLWEASGLKKLPPISNVLYEEDKGYRVIISYPLVKNQTQSLLKNRVIVELGHQINEETKASLEQLDKVIKYLQTKNITARQIWVNAGKKVIVKITSGS